MAETDPAGSASNMGLRLLDHRRLAPCFALSVSLLGVTYAVQRPFRQYQGWEYYDFPLPPDYKQPSEWVFARLMYPSVRVSDRPYTDWTKGSANWTMDYPRSDRHLAQAVR